MALIHVDGIDISVSSVENALEVYNLLVDVIRITKLNTALGPSETEAVLVSFMPCRIDWKNGTEKVMFDKITYYRDAELHCSVVAGVTITTNDRIRYNAKDYEIVDVQDWRNLGERLVISLRRLG